MTVHGTINKDRLLRLLAKFIAAKEKPPHDATEKGEKHEFED